MLDRSIVRTLMGFVPGKLTALVTLMPDTNSPTAITVTNAWLKPMDIRLSTYAGVNLHGNETRIKIPDHELNPTGNGREVRPRDTIQVAGTTYRVLVARLISVRTVWECLVRKEMG